VSALARAVAGPVIAALVVTSLLAVWVTAGGAGTLTRVQLRVSLAAVPMRAFTAQAAAADRSATTFITIRNLTGTADQLVAARSPLARRVVLTAGRGLAGGPRTTIPSLTIPAHGTLQLSPFGSDVVLQDPQPFETLATVPLVLTFRHAGTVTVQASVTAPGTHEGEVRVDLGGEVLACGGAGPCAGVLQVELNGVTCVGLPVFWLGVWCVVQDRERGPGLPGEVGQAESAALLHGPHRGLVPQPGEEVVARVLAEKLHVLAGLHLISRQHHGDVIADGVSLPLPVHAEALAGGLGDQDADNQVHRPTSRPAASCSG